MYYTIYKTTNKINDKIYIGKHQTSDPNDDYLGSGKHISYAIKKYGRENFVKEVLHIFDNEADMNAKEAELVTEEFCSYEHSYNICPGGKGGWGYNNTPEGQKLREHSYNTWQLAGINSIKNKMVSNTDFKSAVKSNAKYASSFALEKRRSGEIDWPFKGKKHSEETKQKLRKSKNVGKSNSQYGSMWITNGTENKKIKNIDIIPEGWYKGRKIILG